MASSCDLNCMEWAKFHYNLHHCTPVEVRLLEGQRVSHWDVAIQCSWTEFFSISFGTIWMPFGIFYYCQLKNDQSFLLHLPWNWTMRRCVEALIPTSDQGAVPPWGSYNMYNLLPNCIVIWLSLMIITQSNVLQDVLPFSTALSSLYLHFLSRNLQTNIWKPFLGKFYPPTKKIVIDKNLHKERFALMESHLSFVQFHF